MESMLDINRTTSLPKSVLRYDFFPLVTEKDEKTCFNAETNDFNQRTACRAPVRWLIYTSYLC